MATQNFKNHGRYDPKFHFFLIPLCLLCLIASVIHVVHERTSPNVLLVPVTFALLVAAFVTRLYALQNQDRIIRLEEQIRLRRLGFDPAGLTIKQLVALRFAPDAEVSGLAARAKVEPLTPKQIKEAVVNWKPDLDRI